MAATTTSLMVASIAISAATAAASAAAQNAAIQRSMRATRNAATVQAAQVNKQHKLESMKQSAEGERIRGRVRVAAAAAGIPIEGSSYGSVLNQAEFTNALNQAIIEENRKSAIARVLSGGSAQLTDLQGRLQNVGMAAFAGGLSGLTAGLQIGSPTATPDAPVAAVGGSGSAGLPALPSYGGGSQRVYT